MKAFGIMNCGGVGYYVDKLHMCPWTITYTAIYTEFFFISLTIPE